MEIKNAKEAEKYLRSLNRNPNLDLGLNVSDGKISVDSRKRVKVNHVAMAEQLVKFINITPGLHPLSRKIMTLRIANPGMSLDAIGIVCGLRNHEIEQFEVDGKNRVKNYMRTYTFEDGVKKFERDAALDAFVKNHVHNKSPLINVNPAMATKQGDWK